MMKSSPYKALTLLVALCAAGCQQAESEPPVSATTLSVTPPPAKAASETETDEAIARREALLAAMADYVAPYPDRREMFVPPKDAPTNRSSHLSEGDVQLRGLVDVGQPQAILDIEGAIALVAAGGEKYGVKVVSIENRKVVLQRGATTWTASLE